jgi:hypothetical protein
MTILSSLSPTTIAMFFDTSLYLSIFPLFFFYDLLFKWVLGLGVVPAGGGGEMDDEDIWSRYSE